jgi:hypothetical protein
MGTEGSLSGWIVTKLALGGVCELLGVVFGVGEIRATRRAAKSAIDALQTILEARADAVSGFSAGDPKVLRAPRPEPTWQEQVDERLASLESQTAAMWGRLEASETKTREHVRSQLKAAEERLMKTVEHLRATLTQFAKDLASGAWRRYAAVVLLLAGVVLQTVASIIAV